MHSVEYQNMRENTLANQALSVVLESSELEELNKLRTMLPTNVVAVVYTCACEEANNPYPMCELCFPRRPGAPRHLSYDGGCQIAYVPEEQVHELIRPLIEVSVETVEIKIGNDSYAHKVQESWYHNGVCLHGHWSGDDGDYYEEGGPDLTSLWDWLASLKYQYGTSPAGAVCVIATVYINEGGDNGGGDSD